MLTLHDSWLQLESLLKERSSLLCLAGKLLDRPSQVEIRLCGSQGIKSDGCLEIRHRLHRVALHHKDDPQIVLSARHRRSQCDRFSIEFSRFTDPPLEMP